MTGIAGRIEATVLQTQTTTVVREFCPCGLTCEYIEKAFAGSNSYENDTSSFLYQKLRSADSIVITIERYGQTVATIADNTYGTYYSTFAEQPLYVGFVVDWGEVFNAFSGGIYRIVATKTILGVVSTQASRKFRLTAFDEDIADNTVKVAITQNSNVLSSPFNLEDLIEGGWVSQYRIPARFGKKTPTLESDEYLSSDRKRLNIQPSVSYEYSLDTEQLPAIIADILNNDTALADQVLITDYSLLTPRQYINFSVSPVGYELVLQATDKEIYLVTFTDRFNNTIRKP